MNKHLTVAELAVAKAAELLPNMSAEEYNALVTDIGEHGQLEPITLYEGTILDGRHRYRATQELGLEPLTEKWTGDDPFAYVISRNLKRRHLSAGQRAMLAAEYAKAPVGKPANSPDKVPTVPQAAKLFGVSERSIRVARHIAEHATPEIITALKTDDMTLNEADKRTRQPTDPAIADSPSMLRQSWLETAVMELRPWFKEAGYTIPENIRIGVSPPRRSRLGCHYHSKFSSDGHHEIYLDIGTDDGAKIIEVLTHELCHACMAAEVNHGPQFQKCADAVGLVPPWTCTLAGPRLTTWVEDFIKRHGPYPGGKFVPREPKEPIFRDPPAPKPKPTDAELEQSDFENLRSWLSIEVDPPDIIRFRGLTLAHRKELMPLLRKIAKNWTALAAKLEHELAPKPKTKKKRK